MNIPRKEYPRPQMVRDKWINLNGQWEFEYDYGKSGIERGILDKKRFDMNITVPFCPESELSGIGNKDFLNAVWYRRNIEIPEQWKEGRVLLNFEAVDYFCQVWVNNQRVGTHEGGYTPFSFDITDCLNQENNSITVYAEDNLKSGRQPAGKQSMEYLSHGCAYTRVTGIWQTVWLEYVPIAHIKSFKLTPDVDNSKLDMSVCVNRGGEVRVVALYEGEIVGKACAKTTGGIVNMSIVLSRLHLWQPLDAKLYQLEIRFEQDKVSSYFGMRKLELGDKAVLINGQAVFQRLVLDQGYYPDGIYTAPDDESLIKDIELSIGLGFNGARLHEKVFERRYIYHADRLGYMIWGEYGNWGFNHSLAEGLEIYLPQWLEAVQRDYSSPALVGWCPFNETWDCAGHKQNDNILKNIYNITKKLDSTRPVIDTSGNYHVETDIYDIHCYEQNVDQFSKNFEPMKNGGEVFDTYKDRQTYKGQPYFVSEYGGIAWNPNDEEGWGYGDTPASVDEYVERYIGLTDVLLSNRNIFALCYTQLYDVEQEMNGIFYYDRTAKFPDEVIERLRVAMVKKAAIEQGTCV